MTIHIYIVMMISTSLAIEKKTLDKKDITKPKLLNDTPNKIRN